MGRSIDECHYIYGKLYAGLDWAGKDEDWLVDTCSLSSQDIATDT